MASMTKTRVLVLIVRANVLLIYFKDKRFTMTRNQVISEIVKILHRLVLELRGEETITSKEGLADISYDLLQLSIDEQGNKPLLRDEPR